MPCVVGMDARHPSSATTAILRIPTMGQLIFHAELTGFAPNLPAKREHHRVVDRVTRMLVTNVYPTNEM
jgi:hypothetical protein